MPCPSMSSSAWVRAVSRQSPQAVSVPCHILDNPVDVGQRIMRIRTGLRPHCFLDDVGERCGKVRVRLQHPKPVRAGKMLEGPKLDHLQERVK